MLAAEIPPARNRAKVPLVAKAMRSLGVGAELTLGRLNDLVAHLRRLRELRAQFLRLAAGLGELLVAGAAGCLGLVGGVFAGGAPGV